MSDIIYTAKQMSEDVNSMTKDEFKKKYLVGFDNCFNSGEDYNKLMKIANELSIEDPQLQSTDLSDEDKSKFNKIIDELKNHTKVKIN